MIDHGRLYPSAAGQVVAYRAGRDGLKGNAVDHFPRPNPIPVFHYPPARHRPDGRRTASRAARSSRSHARSRHTGPSTGSTPATSSADGSTSRRRKGGVRWWYVKATEGSTVQGPDLPRRVREARRRHASRGLPLRSSRARRRRHGGTFFLTNIDMRAGDMLPMLDLEDDGASRRPTDDVDRVWVETVNREIRRGDGRQADHLHALQPRQGVRLPALGGKVQRRLPGPGDPEALEACRHLAALQRPVRPGEERSRLRARRRERDAPRPAAVSIAAAVGASARRSRDMPRQPRPWFSRRRWWPVSAVATAAASPPTSARWSRRPTDHAAPTVTTTTTGGDPGAIVITVTVPMPAAPEPAPHVSPRPRPPGGAAGEHRPQPPGRHRGTPRKARTMNPLTLPRSFSAACRPRPQDDLHGARPDRRRAGRAGRGRGRGPRPVTVDRPSRCTPTCRPSWASSPSPT